MDGLDQRVIDCKSASLHYSWWRTFWITVNIHTQEL